MRHLYQSLRHCIRQEYDNFMYQSAVLGQELYRIFGIEQIVNSGMIPVSTHSNIPTLVPVREQIGQQPVYWKSWKGNSKKRSESGTQPYGPSGNFNPNAKSIEPVDKRRARRRRKNNNKHKVRDERRSGKN